jgi:NADH:ubiquinone oxidoreductase subunit E
MAQDTNFILRHPKDPSALLDIIRDVQGRFNPVPEEAVSAIARAFEEEAGCLFGEVTADGLIGLFPTSCIGMSDQEPSAIINWEALTALIEGRPLNLTYNLIKHD